MWVVKESLESSHVGCKEEPEQSCAGGEGDPGMQQLAQTADIIRLHANFASSLFPWLWCLALSFRPSLIRTSIIRSGKLMIFIAISVCIK